MKRTSKIFFLVLIVGFLCTSGDLFSKAVPGHNTLRPPHRTPVLSYHFDPNGFNIFNDLFPFYSDRNAVCRKPSPVHSTLPHSEDFFRAGKYSFQKFMVNKTQQKGHFLRVEGNNVYESGNSTLLIPKSYSTPLHPVFLPESPSVIIRKAD